MTEQPSPLAPLQHTTFRNVWIANLASSFGGLIQGVGAAWLMTSIAQSVDMIALVQASTSLPLMLFSLVGGAIADSFNRRQVMLATQTFMLVVSAALALGTYFGLMTPWLLLAFTFLIGCGTAINNPSWQASVGELVPRHDIPAAVALNSIGFNISRSVGPAIGGLIVAAAGAAAAFAANAVSYVALILVLLRWRPDPRTSILPREPMGPAMMSGIRYVAMSPHIGTVILRGFVLGLTGSVVLALLPAVAATRLGAGPLIYGLMLGAFGVGAVGGALLGTYLQGRISSENIVRGAFVGFAACAAIAGTSTSPWLTGAGLLLGGCSWVLAVTLFNVAVQLASPRWVVGRALALYQTGTFGGMALGSWVWGLVADSQGLQVALWAAAILLLAGAALGLLLPLPPHTTHNLDPLNRWKEPHVELDLEPRSGPIRIEIGYAIRREDVPAFLLVMADRKRIRRRDGARHWALLRDLGNPELWVETYQSPTWTEYVRHNLRATQADADVTERIRALHQGVGAPIVRRFVERPTNWFAAVTGPKSTIDPP